MAPSPTPTEITLAGNTAISAVIDDFNGDGKKDLVVGTSTGVGGTGTTYYINFLAGNGDGTFQPVQSYTETRPAIMINGFYFGLISADLRGCRAPRRVPSCPSIAGNRR